MTRKLSLLIIGLLLSSCAVGPDYVRPGVSVPTKFKEEKGNAFIDEKAKNWKVAQPQDDINRGEWWSIFHDPNLNALEAQLNRCNQNIANALANYMQARAIVNEGRAGFFPTLTGNLSGQRAKSGGGSTIISTTTGTGTTTGEATTGAGGSASFTRISYSAILDANWEPDIWGLVRRTVEGDEAAAQASQALLAVTRLSAQGSLAQYYFQLAALDMDQKLLDQTVVNYKTALKLTRYQYTSGVAAQADIVQAQSQLEVAEAQAINNGILRAQYEHAIAVLIGRPPADFSMPFRPLSAKPPVIPVTIPTVWLERRPDIAQAERLMQQTNAQIGLALIAYYPAIDLFGSTSAGAVSLTRLINYPSVGWAYGFQLAEIIFDGGLRNATVCKGGLFCPSCHLSPDRTDCLSGCRG